MHFKGYVYDNKRSFHCLVVALIHDFHFIMSIGVGTRVRAPDNLLLMYQMTYN